MKNWILLTLCLMPTALADVLIPLNSTWNYVKGTAAPASDWRTSDFNAAAWSSGPAPFYYGENLGAGTALPDMVDNYTTIYLRRAFSVADPSVVDRMALRVFIDDGYIIYINGREVARFNVASAEPAFNALAQGAIEPTWVTNSLSGLSEYLVAGQNMVAIQVLNGSRGSSDIVFDLQLESTSDTAPPAITSIQPAPSKVTELKSITVTFSEPVQGVHAEDLLVNNSPAIDVTGAGATYTFTFEEPDFGPVDITWDAGHQIADFADPPHPFNTEGLVLNYLLADESVPYLLSVVPPPDTAVRQLSAIELQFSESVTNIDAGDLQVNGTPASDLIVRPANTYIFQFSPQGPGPVNITWNGAHGIQDFARNPFLAEVWNYDVDPNLPVAQVYISEFLTSAEKPTGLEDEDGDLEDWIELYNSGATAVNLGGWSLTDDPEEPGLWTFPAVNIPAGGRLVVFASGKDRKPTAPGGRLHTNFKLGAGGEYLALFNADSPRAAMTEFDNDYPEQRNDYSYALDPNGAWRYYEVPTPGAANGVSSVTGVVPRPGVSHKRGWHDAPFALAITNTLPGVTIRYTTDGSVPTETSGTVYNGPLQVSGNLVVRAAGFRPNHLPSEVITHTYLFAEDVLLQPNNPAGYPSTWGTSSQMPNNTVPADYEMDPEIINDPMYGPQIVEALKALPVIAISVEIDEMFGAANGIYSHPLSRGAAWERPCSIEIIPLSGGDIQEDAGIQIQGNAAREPQKNPKHPMRVTFKGDYGAKRLDYKVFPDSPVTSFDTLVLRADFNYSWLHWNPSQRIRAQRVRDSWTKDSMRAMGGLASHNRYVHLFINGLYWGIYDPSERPDGSFGEAYLGGEKEDYDVINEGQVVDGTATAYNALLSFNDLSTPGQYEAIKQYLDIPQFIDYMLLHFYIGHEDWFRNKNWYAIRPRDGSRGFLYVPWDGEMILGNNNVNRVATADLPSDLHPKLLANEQYRLDFADRVHRHFFNNGALTPAQNIARWQKRIGEIELPIIAESARWGDYRRDVHQFSSAPYELYTREDQWRNELDRLVNNYFPTRTATVLAQLRSVGLYPSVAAPVFSQHGGRILPGQQLQMSDSGGTIYYTMDGSDPRTYYTDQVSSQAQEYSAPIILMRSARIKARVFSGGTWSALTEADFFIGPRIPMRITEIMYNPEPPGDGFEFIELQNLGALPVDISGYYITGVDYIFPPGSVIESGKIIVLGSAENPAAFAQRYPGLTVHGRFGGQLVNRGERLALVTGAGQTVQSVDYDDDSGWPTSADGDGYSLEITDPFGDPDDPANWHASAAANGTPGQSNSSAPVPLVRINEAQAASAGSSDWLEIFAGEAVNMAGWTLSEANSTNIFIFPTVQFAAGSYHTIAMGDASAAHEFTAPFGLDADRETLILSDASGNVRHIFMYGPQANGFTAAIGVDRVELSYPTPGSANQAVAVFATELKLNELVANPAPGFSDWIEIYNPDPQNPASLRGLFLSVSNQLFEITSAAFVAPRGYARLFADEGPGPNHLDFKLPAAGATVRLLDPLGGVIDELTYPAQPESLSYGRFPDGSNGLISFNYSTPEASNAMGFPVNVSSSSGQITITWPSLTGARYRVDWSDDLSTWQSLAELAATAPESAASDSVSHSQRYYRVIALP